MWLVGYLFNNNGMGTWCWETAHALAAAGEAVTLVCSSNVVLPGEPSFEVLRVDPPPRDSIAARLFGSGGMLSRHGPRVMRIAEERIHHGDRRVTAMLLNATEFYDEACLSPQAVVAWARGVTLGRYLQRLARQRFPSARDAARASLGTIGWWRRDWYAYRRADAILAVCASLRDELQCHSVSAALVYPCTHSSADVRAHESVLPVRLVTTAVHLDEPRKRVPWMLEALQEWNGPRLALTLIGVAGPHVRAAAERLPFDVRFTGPVSRADVLQALQEHDIFLFGSALDDWGYALTEAMAHGLAVMAPDISPFDEIVGDAGGRFALDSQASFQSTLAALIEQLPDARARCLIRARKLFSRESLVERIQAAVPHSIGDD